MARVFVLPQSFGHYKFSHYLALSRKFLLLFENEKNSINKATYVFFLAVFGFLVLQ